MDETLPAEWVTAVTAPGSRGSGVWTGRGAGGGSGWNHIWRLLSSHVGHLGCGGLRLASAGAVGQAPACGLAWGLGWAPQKHVTGSCLESRGRVEAAWPVRPTSLVPSLRPPSRAGHRLPTGGRGHGPHRFVSEDSAVLKPHSAVLTGSVVGPTFTHRQRRLTVGCAAVQDHLRMPHSPQQQRVARAGPLHVIESGAGSC